MSAGAKEPSTGATNAKQIATMMIARIALIKFARTGFILHLLSFGLVSEDLSSDQDER